tara:strand:- start:42 stop:398 length:357 start_codon:yes stop_codon:yes gene_type:complete
VSVSLPAAPSTYKYCRFVDVEMQNDVERHAIVSMMVICNDIVIIEHGGRRLWLPNAPVVKEHDNNRDHRDIATALNIQHNPCIFTYSHIHIFTYSRSEDPEIGAPAEKIQTNVGIGST